jgi:hypothetical protein
LDSAVTSSVASPLSNSPLGGSTVIRMCADFAIQRLVHDLVDFDGGQLGQPLGALQPRQRDQLGDQRAQPVGLGEDLGAEPAHLQRVVSGIQHRLGQQRHRSDRGLELVADVGHEVPPGRFQPDRVRFVGRVDHGEAVTQRPDLPAHRRGPAAGPRPVIQR